MFVVFTKYHSLSYSPRFFRLSQKLQDKYTNRKKSFFRLQIEREFGDSVHSINFVAIQINDIRNSIHATLHA